MDMEDFNVSNNHSNGQTFEDTAMEMGSALMEGYVRNVDTRVRRMLGAWAQRVPFDVAIEQLNRLRDDADRTVLAQALPAEKVPAREERRRMARTTRHERELLGWTKMPAEVDKILEGKRRTAQIARAGTPKA